MRILVYAEVQNGEVAGVTRELITAARSLAGMEGEVEALLLADDPNSLTSSLAGANCAILMRHPSLSPYNPQAHGLALEAAVASRAPDLVLVGYTSVGLDLAAFVAVRRDLPLVSYCVNLARSEGGVTAESQIYGGKLMSTVTVPLPAVIAVNPSVFRESEGAAPANQVDLAAPESLGSLSVAFLSATLPDPSGVDITRSERLLCVGRGIGSADLIEEAREVAGLLGAELVGSRPIIDAGWLPKERQVGKSGRKVKPKLYLAMGVSGAPEHLEGMSSAELIVAINSDPRAPIFGQAHIGACVDMTELLPALKERLNGRG
jgi:electron transfer flavoprotein alpha subunit